jgi:thermostable hemolysin
MSFDSALEYAATSSLASAPTTRRTLAAKTGALERHDRESRQRAPLEEFIRDEFLAHFGARVRHFMPELLALRDADGAVRAAVGCRAATTEPLFLETYTREPIEAALARRTGFFVPRERIVEIGSLACRNAAGAIAIVRALVPHLLHSGFTWVVFTGADTVMNVFRYLGLSPRELCRADPALLGAARHEWGSYYDHDPHVMAGRIEDGLRARPGKMQ